MKNDLEHIVGRKLPYRETNEYVEALINRCAETAIENCRKSGPEMRLRTLGNRIFLAAASVAVIIVTTITIFLYHPAPATDRYMSLLQQPDIFENVAMSLSDEQLEALSYTFVQMSDYNYYYYNENSQISQ